MTIGVVVWQLQLAGCDSLKAKRSVIRSLKDRLHKQFNVSVSETAYHDDTRRAELTACVAAVSQPQANKVLDAADAMVESEARARIVDSYTTYY